LSHGTLLSNKSGYHTQTNTEIGSDQLAVRSLPCHDVLTADWSVPISVLVATDRGVCRNCSCVN